MNLRSSQYDPGRSSSRSGIFSNPPFESPGQLAVIAVVVWLVGAIIHPLAILAPVGLLLLLVAGVAYLLRPKRHTMYWRGREIDLDDDRGGATQLYRTLFRR
jgi:cbb3-type cytochrome oxidase subunit 3